MGINSTEVAYNFGQFGSVFNDGTAAITPPTDKVFVAITFVEATTFDSSSGLVADNDVASGREYMGTDTAAHDAVLSPNLGESGTGGVVVDVSNSFPAGLTIFGRWTEIDIASGMIIAYIGD
jgi:hypothetical protein